MCEQTLLYIVLNTFDDLTEFLVVLSSPLPWSKKNQANVLCSLKLQKWYEDIYTSWYFFAKYEVTEKSKQVCKIYGKIF